MIWLAHLFRRNHDARRARWFVFGACCGSIVVGAAYEQTAQAADEAVCATYAAQVERLVMQLTNDFDVAQAARNRGESYCYVIDAPVSITIDPEEGTAPAIGPAPSARDKWCRKHFGSYRADGTVLPLGKRKRVACPFPG